MIKFTQASIGAEITRIRGNIQKCEGDVQSLADIIRVLRWFPTHDPDKKRTRESLERIMREKRAEIDILVVQKARMETRLKRVKRLSTSKVGRATRATGKAAMAVGRTLRRPFR